MFSELNNYAQKLKIHLEKYVNDSRSYPPYQKTGDFIQDPIDRERQADIKLMLQDAIQETVCLQKTLVKIELTYQKIVTPDKTIDPYLSLNKDESMRHKRSVIGSIFKWHFGGEDDSSETTKQLKENIKILKQNQNLEQDKIKQPLKMNQLSTVETTRNRKLLKDLMKNMIQLNFTVNQLEYQDKQLYTSVNFINFMLAVRHKLAMIRDSTFVIQQDLDHLYMYLNTLSIKKLISEMLTPYDL